MYYRYINPTYIDGYQFGKILNTLDWLEYNQFSWNNTQCIILYYILFFRGEKISRYSGIMIILIFDHIKSSSRIGGVEDCLICLNRRWPPSKLTKSNFDDISGYNRCRIAILVSTPRFSCTRNQINTSQVSQIIAIHHRKIKHGGKKVMIFNIIWSSNY